jgi:hypothetical protein
MRKRLVVVVVVVVAVVTGLGLLGWPRRHRINREGFERITEGMTRQEVEDILGRPPGDYTVRREGPFILLHPPAGVNWSSQEHWISDDGWMVVTFDPFDGAGPVVEKEFSPVDDWPQRPWTARVRRALPRLPWTR